MARAVESSRRSSGTRAVLIAGPAILLAAAGITHPHHLTIDSATWWATLHTLLLPVFPLLGLAHWLLLQSVAGLAAWVARVAAFGYATFYTGLDVLAGIGTGTLVERGLAPSRVEVDALFAVGNDLGFVGALCLFVACGASSLAFIRRVGRAAAPGAAVLMAGAVPFFFWGVHIYWPAGVISMLLLAGGFSLLTIVAPVSEPGHR